jgi:hypothetical protein
MSNKFFLLILIILIALTIPNFHLNQYNTSKSIPKNIQALIQNNVSKTGTGNALNQSSNSKKENLNPYNPEIKKYFYKVADVPYKPNYTSNVPKTPAKFWKDNSGDCDDKSVAFADYLNRIGAEDVKLVTITHESGKYAHSVVMWKNYIFDAAAEPPIYNMNRATYYNFVEKKGFKLWTDYSYTSSKKSLAVESGSKSQITNKSSLKPSSVQFIENTLQTNDINQ